MDSTTAFSLSVICSEHDWDKLKPEWNALADRSDTTSIFSTWEWLRPWWKHYHQPGDSLFIVTVHYGARLVGAAPLYKQPIVVLGATIGTRIGLIGDLSGDSDYLDFICDRAFAEVVRDTLVDFLFSSDLSWDVLALMLIDGASPLIAALHRAAERRHLISYVTSVPCSRVTLPEDFTLYLNEVGRRRFRTKLRALIRQYSGDEHLSLTCCQKAEELSSSLDSLFKLHTKRWNEKGAGGSFASKARRDFYRDMSLRLLQKQRLRLYSLIHDGASIAHEMDLEYKNKVYCLQQGYEPAFASRAVGNMLKALILRECIDQKIGVYDFLGGDDAYKKNWAASFFVSQNVIIARPGWAALLFVKMPKTKERLRRSIRKHLPKRLRAFKKKALCRLRAICRILRDA